MHKTSRFTFNLDPEERRLLALLAEEVRRSQGDTLCWLIRLAAREAQAGRGEREKGGRGAGGMGRLRGDDLPLAILGDWEVWGVGTPAREDDDEPF